MEPGFFTAPKELKSKYNKTHVHRMNMTLRGKLIRSVSPVTNVLTNNRFINDNTMVNGIVILCSYWKELFKGWRPDEDAHSDIPHRSVVPLCKTIMPALRYSPIIVPHFELVKLLLTITRVLLSKSYPIQQVYRLFRNNNRTSIE